MGQRLKKCPRADRKYGTEARDNGGLILSYGHWDGEADGLGAEYSSYG